MATASPMCAGLTCSAPADPAEPDEVGQDQVVSLVAGVDSSTQSCKVVVRDADSGELVREGRASHPDGTEVHPDAWWSALGEAVDAAGGLADVAAGAGGGQQHGVGAPDEAGEGVRPPLLWDDTPSPPPAPPPVGGDGGPGGGGGG